MSDVNSFKITSKTVTASHHVKYFVLKNNKRTFHHETKINKTFSCNLVKYCYSHLVLRKLVLIKQVKTRIEGRSAVGISRKIIDRVKPLLGMALKLPFESLCFHR